ncbi:uncharacterized protein LOC121408148 isoform X2 [Lytechinus variegatus]|uniref:uncharacterized protein LOC121408148 isoform X2 n=1 Tax=Lytechinus variegatus TaxID=7654 RepID=UPI001BB1D319|nr:uncharacterized protein LOC121408148 isoform X2 [Lytechinus variegatus]
MKFNSDRETELIYICRKANFNSDPQTRLFNICRKANFNSDPQTRLFNICRKANFNSDPQTRLFNICRKANFNSDPQTRLFNICRKANFNSDPQTRLFNICRKANFNSDPQSRLILDCNFTGESVQNKLKRKENGPQSADTLRFKRPLLKPKAGTKHRPCIQESRLARIHRLMISPQTKLYCHFLQYSNKIFDSINLLLQQKEPCLHILHRKLSGTYRDLLLRFMKQECIAACSHVNDVSDGKENQRSDKDLTIGTEAKEYIKSMTTEEGDVSLQLTKVDLDYFYLSVRKYYQSACGNALKTWPFDVKFLQKAEMFDINLRRKVSFFS